MAGRSPSHGRRWRASPSRVGAGGPLCGRGGHSCDGHGGWSWRVDWRRPARIRGFSARIWRLMRLRPRGSWCWQCCAWVRVAAHAAVQLGGLSSCCARGVAGACCCGARVVVPGSAWAGPCGVSAAGRRLEYPDDLAGDLQRDGARAAVWRAVPFGPVGGCIGRICSWSSCGSFGWIWWCQLVVASSCGWIRSFGVAARARCLVILVWSCASHRLRLFVGGAATATFDPPAFSLHYGCFGSGLRQKCGGARWACQRACCMAAARNHGGSWPRAAPLCSFRHGAWWGTVARVVSGGSASGRPLMDLASSVDFGRRWSSRGAAG
ncbi:hypothetical protein VPH35_007021 [Triticum aestivum]